MKIAIATNANKVSAHFGHCEGFKIYQVEDGKILEEKFQPSPGHRPGFLPVFLHEKGVDVIISGGMGGSAQELFKENNIKVVVGAEGDCDRVIANYLEGELASTGEICSDHSYEGEC